MAKVLVLYQSSWGHMEQMANAAAEGARAGGAQVTVKRVPELMSEQDAQKQGMKWNQSAPWAKPEELPDYDAVILGIPTRYGRMVAPMAHFWDQTVEIWSSGKGQRQPSEKELAGARFQGKRVAEIAARLAS
jgi:NAD(P)H dehydrogenase (quinone)